MAGNLDEWQYKLNNKDPFEYSSDDEDNYQPTDPAAKQTTPGNLSTCLAL